MNQDARRGWRTAAQVGTRIATLAILAVIVWQLRGQSPMLANIAYGLIALLITAELFAGAENVAARLDLALDGDGAHASIDSRAGEKAP